MDVGMLVVLGVVGEAKPLHYNISISVSLCQAASVFVLYATSQANSMAQNQSRKTIYSQDVISAMNEMEFDKFVRPLENSLASMRRQYYTWL